MREREWSIILRDGGVAICGDVLQYENIVLPDFESIGGIVSKPTIYALSVSC